MSNELFEWCDAEASPATDVRAPRLLGTSFGDGYGQMLPDGINHNPQSWSLTFTRDTADIDAIQAFYEQHGGWDGFFWVNPRGELMRVRWASTSWTWDGPTVRSITATFVQHFDGVPIPESVELLLD